MKPKMYPSLIEELAPLLDALSHPARLQIMMHLARFKSCPAGNISNRLPLCKSTVSQHMARLRETGLISSTPAGLSQQYHLNLERLHQTKEYFLYFIDLIIKENEQKSDCVPPMKEENHFQSDTY